MDSKSGTIHPNWGRTIQKRLQQTLAQMHNPRKSRLCHIRNTPRHLRLPLRTQNHGRQDITCWLLLAYNGRRLHHIRQKVRSMPKTRADNTHAPGRTPPRFFTMVVLKMGNGHNRPLCTRERSGQVPSCRGQLLLQVDRSITISHHHGQPSPTLHLKKHHLPLRHPPHNHNRQWSPVHRQGPHRLLPQSEDHPHNKLRRTPPNQRSS